MSALLADAPEFQLRPAGTGDLEFAWPLYRDLMKPLALELLAWNEAGQKATIEEGLAGGKAEIILVDGSNAGWLQVGETPDGLYLGQLYVLPVLQNRGIGAAIVRRLTDRARAEGKAVSLDVMKNNRARALYERLGFRVVGASEYKFQMLWRDGA